MVRPPGETRRVCYRQAGTGLGCELVQVGWGLLFWNLGYTDFVEGKRVVGLYCNSGWSVELHHQACMQLGQRKGRVYVSTILPEEYRRNLG